MSEETNTKDTKTATDGTQHHQYTEADMIKMRKKMLAFYRDEVQFLRPQAEYEKLLADIEEHKTRRLFAMGKSAAFYAQADAAEKEAAEQEARLAKAKMDELSKVPIENPEAPITEAPITETPIVKSLNNEEPLISEKI